MLKGKWNTQYPMQTQLSYFEQLMQWKHCVFKHVTESNVANLQKVEIEADTMIHTSHNSSWSKHVVKYTPSNVH